MHAFRLHTIFAYVIAETSGAWVVGTISYIIWVAITQMASNPYIAFVWLALPAFIMVITTPIFAKKVERMEPHLLSKLSLSFRIAALSGIAAIMIAFNASWDIGIIVLLGLTVAFLSSLDGVIHAPVAFILAKKRGVNLVRFRVTLMLLIRGANVITPTLAILLLRRIDIALVLLLLGGVIGLISSILLSKVPLARQDNENDKSGSNDAKLLVVFYSFLLFALNAVFGHVTAIMLAYHAWAGDVFAYQNFSFFTGFLIMSVILIYRPTVLSAPLNNIMSVLSAISISLFLISLNFALAGVLSGLTVMVPIFFAGAIYGVNLHFVTTVLPSFLSLNGIYRNLNFGKIGATVGALISGLWVAQISIDKTYIELGFYILAIGAAFLVLIPLSARLFFNKHSHVY